MQSLSVGQWESLPSRRFVETAPGQPQQWAQPTPRAVCTMVAWGDAVYVFGGFDGARRTSEFSEYSFQNRCWFPVRARGIPPTARDRHAAAVAGNMMYVFGGHDGDRRLGDTHAFDFVAARWLTLVSTHCPTARQSHCMCTYKAPGGGERIYLFGGFDGSYRNDLHVLDLSTHQWSKVATTGNGPTPRYRSTMVCSANVLVVFGGHDGSTFLNDVYVFNPENAMWSRIHATNLPPLPRDSHTAVAFGSSILVFGGSSGAAMNDLHELCLSPVAASASSPSLPPTTATASSPAQQPPPPTATTRTATHTPSSLPPGLEPLVLSGDVVVVDMGGSGGGSAAVPVPVPAPATSTGAPTTTLPNGTPHPGETTTTLLYFQATWSPLFPGGAPPSPRFCHAAALVGNSKIVVFGGFDGKKRNSDLYQLNLSAARLGARAEVTPSTLLSDLAKFVGNPLLADVFFVLEDTPTGERVPGHRLLLSRVPFFDKLWASSSSASSTGGASCVVEIQGVDQATFLNVLRYVYTDECDMSSKFLVSVHQAAERFGLDRLKAMCENAMLDTLDANNASALFAAADRLGSMNLRSLTFNYILANFDQVSVTSDFEEMGRTRVDLVFELLRRRGTAKQQQQPQPPKQQAAG